MTGTEWADEYFYLSPESSYIEGPWTTNPMQVVPLNIMCNDSVREVYWRKSARIGYTKCLVAALFYLTEHKKRNTLIYQPTDGDAADFVKDEIDPGIRDVPVMRAMLPSIDVKSSKNTESKKQFFGATMDIKGGTTPKNYRRMSKDVVAMDEASGFPREVGPEGDPKILARKRLVGSVFPKFIAGSTPTVKGQDHMEDLEAEADVRICCYVPCPHCGEYQFLKWGGKDCDYGIKWHGRDASTAYYCCEHSQCAIDYADFGDMLAKCYWKDPESGIWTQDGEQWFDASGSLVATPHKVALISWAVYSLFDGWDKLVRRFFDALTTPLGIKGFTNTDLGEYWDDPDSQQLDWEVLYKRRERYAAQVPKRAVFLTGGIDTQDDRLEFYVYAWGGDRENWLVWRYNLSGNLAQPEIWKKADELLRTEFKHESGATLRVSRWCWDSGGNYTKEVYAASKRNGTRWVIPTKGYSTYGKPVAEFPRTRTKHGVYLTMVGTDTAKDLMAAMLRIQQDHPDATTPGYCHLPLDDRVFGETEAKQLVAEKRILKIIGGRRVYRWDSEGRRNEAWDCFILAMVALAVSEDNFGIDLNTHQLTNKKQTNNLKALGQKLGGGS